MSDGMPTRPKRNGARTFKNPPQPHMCIQDYIQGSSLPCYINILSWDKIDMPGSPNQRLPLYGGMKLTPPRTEDKNTNVFAVIANPEVLRLKGKNAQDQNEQSSLIEVLLDFVETMNKGVVFTRVYKILKDRDITGELKEVWVAVQTQREKESLSQQETWIDGQPAAQQYSQSNQQQLDQQQQQQQQPQHQQQQPSPQPQLQLQSPPSQQIPPQVQQHQQQHQPPQHQQHHQQQQQQQQQLQQNPQMMHPQNSYMMSQPPQYPQPNLVYNPVPNNDCANYDRYSYQQQQSPVPVTQNDLSYQKLMLASMGIAPSYNNSNGSPMGPDRFNYRERGRTLPQQPMPKQQPSPPQQPPPPQQQSCPAYPTSQYHFQQLPRQMVPQFINSNMNPNYGGQQMNPVVTSHYTDYMIMQHQHMTTGMEQRQVENQIHAEVHRMQQPPAPQYQPPGMGSYVSEQVMTNSKRRTPRQYLSGPRKNNPNTNQNNSPTHLKQGSPMNSGPGASQSKENITDNVVKPKSPVKVLQRDLSLQNKQNISQPSPDKNSKSMEKSINENKESSKVQITDLDEDDTKVKDVSETSNEVVFRKPEALNYAAALKDYTDSSKEVKTSAVESPTSSSSESHVQEFKQQEVKHHFNQKQRSIKTVLKRNKSGANDTKGWSKHNKSLNGMRTNYEQKNSNAVDRLHDKDGDEHVKNSQPINEVNTSAGWNSHVKQKSSDSPKRAQSTVNSIIKSVFKINQGNNATVDDAGSGKKQKTNGQVKSNAKITNNEHEETNHGYTILKKSEVTTTSMSTSEDVANDIAKLTIQDCKDTAEKNAVLS